METVKYAVTGQRATIQLNRPGQMNALNQQMRLELSEALKMAASDENVRVVILSAAGPVFCSGADLVESSHPEPGVIERQLNEEYGVIISAVMEMSKPVICVVQGPMVGAGCALPLAADLTVMAEEAVLYPAFTSVGLVPDCGVSWFLQKRLGYKQAFQLCLENNKIPAARCMELGLVNRVVPADKLLEVSDYWADMVEKNAPLVPGYLKQLFAQVTDVDLKEAIACEATFQDELAQTEESQQRVAQLM